MEILTLLAFAFIDTDYTARLIEEQHGRSQNMLTKIYVQFHLSLNAIYNHIAVKTAWMLKCQRPLRGGDIHYAEIITDSHRIRIIEIFLE